MEMLCADELFSEQQTLLAPHNKYKYAKCVFFCYKGHLLLFVCDHIE